MKKIITITIIILIIIVITTSLIINNHNEKIKLNDLWPIYEDNLINIKKTMDEITISNDDFYWWELKDFEIEDKTYQTTLNNLVADIRICYMIHTEDGENYSTSNPIIDYKDSKKITKKELDSLNKMTSHNKSCIKNLEKYNQLLISEDLTKRDEFLYEINTITSLKNNELFKNKEATYDELLLRKYIEIASVNKLTMYLKNEYTKLR